MSLVTMFTDASWNHRTNIGVWVMWAKLNGNTIRYSGQLRLPVAQIGTAELSAIANGLYCIKRYFACEADSKIIAQTDSLEAILAIKNDKHPRQDDRNLVAYIKEFIATHGWQLDLRHVKGHKGAATPRNAVNTWCDKECKRRMSLALASIESQQEQLAAE